MKVELRDIQAAQYRILCEMDRVCRKYDIPYFLGQGTLLGAAKYQGFIPWDDDVDTLIPYAGLQKLMEVFPKEAGAEYLLTGYRVEKYLPLPWSKIRLAHTLSRPKRYRDIPINWGICIDLFPIYSISNCAWLRRVETLLYRAANKLLMAEYTKYEEGRGLLERMLEKVPIWARHKAMDAAIWLLMRHGEESRYVLIPCKGIKVVRRDLIFGKAVQTLPFGDREFPVPAKYHEYLTLNYGDYQQPLPPEQQRGHDVKTGEIEWRL